MRMFHNGDNLQRGLNEVPHAGKKKHTVNESEGKIQRPKEKER